MNWIGLKTDEQLDLINQASKEKLQIIFKHSTKCSISSNAYKEMEKVDTTAWYVDIFEYRPISNKIAELYDVKHESPQVLFIKDGHVVYHESHRKITQTEIEEQLKKF